MKQSSSGSSLNGRALLNSTCHRTWTTSRTTSSPFGRNGTRKRLNDFASIPAGEAHQ